MRLEGVSLTFAYAKNGPAVLDGRSVAPADGAVTAITGASGAGKSTLLAILGLLARPRYGTVLLDGHDVGLSGDRSRASLRARHFGYLFQDAGIDSRRTVLDSVLEVALYRGDDPRAHRERALDLLDRLGVLELAARKPFRVSGGQAQRIGLARALLFVPDIIIADEPTANLDSTTASVVLTHLHEAATRGSTVLIATHDARALVSADEIVEL